MFVVAQTLTAYAGSTKSDLDELFRREALKPEEAILLATCPRELLQTPPQKRFVDGMTYLRSIDVPMDWAVAETLLWAEDVVAAQTQCAAAFGDWPERLRSHQRLERLRTAQKIPFLDMVAVVAAYIPAHAREEREKRDEKERQQEAEQSRLEQLEAEHRERRRMRG